MLLSFELRLLRSFLLSLLRIGDDRAHVLGEVLEEFNHLDHIFHFGHSFELVSIEGLAGDRLLFERFESGLQLQRMVINGSEESCILIAIPVLATN